MNILVIDPHGTRIHDGTTNVHARNSLIVSQYLGADLMYDEETQIYDPSFQKDYDVVIFVHTSRYVQVKKLSEFLRKSTNPKYYYVTNEYNLGEAVTLFDLAKNYGATYEVIANYPMEANVKIGTKQAITEWNVVNLNTLIFNPNTEQPEKGLFDMEPEGVIYFGSYRKGRLKYFQKYFDKDMYVSTSHKNIKRFMDEDVNASFIKALKWNGTKSLLSNFKATLYIEDEHTHKHFNFLANRFYEALTFGTPIFFDKSCLTSIQKSVYSIPEFFMIDSKEELHEKANQVSEFDFEGMKKTALEEKEQVLKAIKDIVTK